MSCMLLTRPHTTSVAAARPPTMWLACSHV